MTYNLERSALMSVNSFDNYPLAWKPDKTSLKPPYVRALAENLEMQIKTGLLMPGTKLPPQREIADYLDLHYTTITKVYNICREKGLIYGTVGKGTFVAERSYKDATLYIGNDGNTRIDMGTLNNFSEYSTLTEKAARTVIESGRLHELLDYSHPFGFPHQRMAGVRWMEQLGVHTDVEHTAIVTGGQNALTVVLMSLFSRNDCIAVDEYTYANFIEIAKLLDLTLVPIAGDDSGISPDNLKKKCRTSKIKGIYLMPSCANPTTIVMPEQRRDEIADIIKQENLILIEDDIGSWIAAAEGKKTRSIFDRVPENSIYICSTSKSLCPGLRIAFLVYAEQFKTQIHHGLSNMNVKTSSLDAEIITELLLSGDAYKLSKMKYRSCQKATALFQTIFPEVRLNRRICFFQWLPVSAKKTHLQIEEELSARGIIAFHSSRFAVTPKADKAFIRVSISSAKNTKRLEKGLSILRVYLTENPPAIY